MNVEYSLGKYSIEIHAVRMMAEIGELEIIRGISWKIIIVSTNYYSNAKNVAN